MIVLDNGDKLRGDAAAASVVDYTIYGLDNNTLSQLADGQLSDSTGDLYTADSVDVITTIVIVNTDSSARAVNLFMQPSGGTARRILPKDLSLGAGYSVHWSGDKISVMNASGETVTTVSGASGVDTSGTPVANDIARFTDADTIEGRSYAELKGDLNLEIGTDVLAEQTIGIADDNLVEMDDADAADDDYAKFTANGLEGRSYAEVKSDLNLEIGTDVLAQQTIGIADDNLLEVDGSPNDDEYARFTANGLEGRTEAEFKGDFNLEIGTDVLAEQTIGIADDNLLEVDDADAADDDYAKFTANGLEGRSYAEVKTDLGFDYQTIYIDSGAMIPCTTNGAEASTEEYGTNDIDMDVLAFDAGATEERVQFKLVMPENWDRSTVKVKFYWGNASGASAADTVEWGIKAGALSNDDAIDAALGTPQVISDTVIADGDLHITSATPALTIGGTPALGDLVVFEVYRNTDGTDDMAEDAWLLGCLIQFQVDQTVSAW